MLNYLSKGFCLLLISLNCYAQADKITILNELNYPPFSSKEGGLSVSLVKAAFLAAQVEADFQAIPFARLVKMVSTGQALAGLNIIKEDYAENEFIFPTQPIYSVSTQYYFHIDSPSDVSKADILDSDDLLVGEVIGFMYSPAHKAKPFKRLKSSTEQQLLDMLLTKRLDAAYITKEVVCNLAISTPSYLQQLKTTKAVGVHKVDLHIAFAKTHPSSQIYADLFDQGLKKIKANGTYQKIIRHYLGDQCN